MRQAIILSLIVLALASCKKKGNHSGPYYPTPTPTPTATPPAYVTNMTGQQMFDGYYRFYNKHNPSGAVTDDTTFYKSFKTTFTWQNNVTVDISTPLKNHDSAMTLNYIGPRVLSTNEINIPACKDCLYFEQYKPAGNPQAWKLLYDTVKHKVVYYGQFWGVGTASTTQTHTYYFEEQ